VSKERIIEVGHAIVVARNNVTFGESMARVARKQLAELEAELDTLVGDRVSTEESCIAMTVDDVWSKLYVEPLQDMLSRGSVLVAVNATCDNVVVPPKYKSDPALVLRIGYDLHPPVLDLVVDERGISGALTFSGAPFQCTLPWSAVLSVRSEAEATWKQAEVKGVRPRKIGHLQLVPLCSACNDDPKVACAECDGPVEDDGPGAA